MKFSFDVIVVGAGAAGLSAALWCDELNLRTLVLESGTQIGGQLHWVYNPIENHLGADAAANGAEMCARLERQIAPRKFELRLSAEISEINLTTKQITLATGEILTAKFLILATGVRRRKLNIAGETEFIGRGILESGKRDAARVAGKTVAIIGGGDAAAENAVILSKFAAQVTLIHRRREFRARAEFLDQIKTAANVKILPETEITQILGDEKITAVELKSGSKTDRLAIDFLLLRIGVQPNSEAFRKQLKTDENDYLIVDHAHETSAKNVFAVGDISNPLAPTLSSAVGAGATVAKIITARLQSANG